KSKKPRRPSPAGFCNTWVGSTLRELEALARTRLAVLLALFHARIAREEALGLEGGTQVGVGLDEGARDPVADGAGLAGRAAAGDIDPRVELGGRFRLVQRGGGGNAQRFRRKIVVERAAIDRDLAAAVRESDARNGGLAAAGTEEFLDVCHRKNYF